MTGSPTLVSKARLRILNAATESFTTQGYARTTTLAIAEKAQVAEVTLFRHFGSKEELFKHVVANIARAADIGYLESQLIGDLQTDLLTISRQMLAFFAAHRDAIRMLMFESVSLPEMNEALAQNPNVQVKFLSTYLEKQMESGTLREQDPKALARAFISMHFGFAVGFQPIANQLTSQISPEGVSNQFVALFLEGVSGGNNDR